MMETFDERPIDEHIIKNFEGSYMVFWTILKKDRSGYIKALIRLLNEGKLMNDQIEDEEIVALVRIINHINLEMKFIPNGIALKENAKANYYWNVMNKKVEPVVYYSSKINSIGKVDKYDEKPGWAEKILMEKEKVKNEKPL